VFPFKPRDPATAPVLAPQGRKGNNVVSLRGDDAKAQAKANAVDRSEAAASAGKAERAAPPQASPAPLISLMRNTPAAASVDPVPAPLPAPHSLVAQIEQRVRDPRYFLTPEHDIVDAPAIGPKTAQRLKTQGIATVRDLLKADPQALAAALDARHFTAETVMAWQHQATLVCKVPGLRGTHAQLLVGAGYTSADTLANADAEKVCADVLTFAHSEEGQRLLRNGEPPDLEKIKAWLSAARSTAAA
jgi:predicted flap endonuclease-1-like 5' DNA nuclease